MKTINFSNLKEEFYKKKLLKLRREHLRLCMLRATGKRRRQETKEEMAEHIVKFSTSNSIERILGTFKS